MANILLVEPDYRSKFPPLGLMRISTYHKNKGDNVSFLRGLSPTIRQEMWDRIYVSSLFTYDLPKTVKTINYYSASVRNSHDLLVGGVAATLMPQYIRDRAGCRVIIGQLDKLGSFGPGTPAVADYLPDYSLIDTPKWNYKPPDSYFCRVTKGCLRRCKFCAVPVLEPAFGKCKNIRRQIREVINRYGERQHLVLLDNNVLAIDDIQQVVADIACQGFSSGTLRNGKLRKVDFNQGIDARLITKKVAAELRKISIDPIRLAFDNDHIRSAYKNAIKFLAEAGFRHFTNYVMFNYNDTPESLYNRLRYNYEIEREYNVRITGFPMRFIPINSVDRGYISEKWKWRYLRGIQCILLATHGIVSPNLEYFQIAFGSDYKEFMEIISMPDRYIIHRNYYKENEAKQWRKQFRKLSPSSKTEFIDVLGRLRKSDMLDKDIRAYGSFRALLEHYYPNRERPHD